MPSIINFSSCFFRTVNATLPENGGKTVRLNMSASFTKEVRDKMDWQEPVKPEGFEGRTIDEAAESVDLEGTLHGRTMTLAPNEDELRGIAFSIDIAEVKNFELVTIENKKNGSKARELRFQVLTSAPGCLEEIEHYTDRIGRGKGTLKISYVQQQELDLNGPKASNEKRAAAEEIPLQS